ncbi:unnamed protein product [Closterium sp. NIES-65]|nr:unnamed protein product [Closterium sp. NIES-65]
MVTKKVRTFWWRPITSLPPTRHPPPPSHFFPAVFLSLFPRNSLPNTQTLQEDPLKCSDSEEVIPSLHTTPPPPIAFPGTPHHPKAPTASFHVAVGVLGRGAYRCLELEVPTGGSCLQLQVLQLRCLQVRCLQVQVPTGAGATAAGPTGAGATGAGASVQVPTGAGAYVQVLQAKVSAG